MYRGCRDVMMEGVRGCLLPTYFAGTEQNDPRRATLCTRTHARARERVSVGEKLAKCAETKAATVAARC